MTSYNNELTEGDMVRYVIGFLTGKGYKVWRQPNYGYFDRARFLKLYLSTKDLKTSLDKSYSKMQGTLKGVPDVVGFHKKTGAYIGVEIKIGTDVLSDEQRAFLNELHVSGGEAYVAKTPETFARSWYAKHPETVT